MPSRKIFRPQNCGAAAHTLPATGRVEDDPRLSRLYNRFYAQGDRLITSAERAADRKLARLSRCDKSVVRSSVMPSAKYCWSGSLPRLANGNTTIDKRGVTAGWEIAGVARAL